VSTTRVDAEFDRCRERLERAVVASCELHEDWPNAVTGGIYTALEFAAAEPTAALVLTRDAITRRHGPEPAFVAMVDHFAGLLARGAPAPNPRLPDAVTLLTRIARQVNLQIEAGRAGEMMEIAPDLTFLALMPYLGFSGARRWSHPSATA
jgi:hypothetical protein